MIIKLAHMPRGGGVRRDPDFFLRGGVSNTVTRFSTDRVRRPSRPPISSLPPWGRAGVGARVRPSLHNACLVPAFYRSQPAGDACRSSVVTAGQESPAGQLLQGKDKHAMRCRVLSCMTRSPLPHTFAQRRASKGHAAARFKRSRTPSQSGVSGGSSTHICCTPRASNSRSTAKSDCAAASLSLGWASQ